MAAEGVGIVFCSVEAIIAIVHAIRKAVESVRQNKYDCEDIARTVATVSAILNRLRETTPMAMDPAMGGALEDLMLSLERALDLVIVCQQGGRVRRFFGARDMARELRRVQEDITRKVTTGSFAANVHITIALTNTTQCAPPPPPPPPSAGALAESCAVHSLRCAMVRMACGALLHACGSLRMGRPRAILPTAASAMVEAFVAVHGRLLLSK